MNIDEYECYESNIEISNSVYETALNDIENYFVSFGIEDQPAGSATLINIDGRYGFLTASHVAKHLLNSSDLDVCVVCRQGLHRLAILKDHLECFCHGPGSHEACGPDLAFIQIHDLNLIGTLKAIKSFYHLNQDLGYTFDLLPDKRKAICFILGAPAEFAKEEGTRRQPDHILLSTHFAGRAQITLTPKNQGIDYLHLVTFAGSHGFPSNYGGTSGGGVWNIPLTMTPNQPETLHTLRPELIGVAFYQTALEVNSRTIIAHGHSSLYRMLRRS